MVSQKYPSLELVYDFLKKKIDFILLKKLKMRGSILKKKWQTFLFIYKYDFYFGVFFYLCLLFIIYLFFNIVLIKIWGC